MNAFGNQIEDCTFGIQVEVAKNVDISNNYISAYLDGILNLGSDKLLIRANNLIEARAPISAYFVTSRLDIISNPNINVTNAPSSYGGTGIIVGAGPAKQTVVRQNSINLANNTGGIIVGSSPSGQYVQNTVNGLGSGLQAQLSPDNLYCCNVFNSTSGFVFYNGCNDSEIRNSDMSNNQLGLIMQDNSLIGHQWNKGNNWDMQSAAVIDLVDPDLNAYKMSTFKVANGFFPSTVFGPSDWFGMPTGVDDFCNTPTGLTSEYCGLPANFSTEPPQTSPTEVDLFVTNTYTGSNVEGRANNWFGQANLFQKLIENEPLKNNSTVLQNFHNAKSGLPLGKLATVRHKIDRLFVEPTAEIRQIDSLKTILLGKSRLILAMDSIWASVGFDETSNYALQVENMLLSSEGIQKSLDALTNLVDSLQKLTALSIVSENNAINATEQWEINEKVVNDIYLNFLFTQNYDFSTSQKTMIENIAAQCPELGGRTVFQARGIQKFWLDDESNWCNTPNLMLEEALERTSKIFQDNTGLTVNPNPANDFITVSAADNLVNGRFRLFGFDGRERMNLLMPDSKRQIETAQLSPGIYFYQYRDEQGRILKTGSLSIVH